MMVRIRLLLLAVLIGLPSAASAQTPTAPPPKDPFLRLETGMHAAPVRRIAATPDGNTIVTVSHDKTARVWRPDGTLVRTLRMPIAPGPSGQLGALAISPDGRYMAVGGNVGPGWDDRSWVYIYALEDGQLIRPLRLIPASVNALAWSPDGSRLVVGFSGGKGVFAVEVANLPAVRQAGAPDQDWGTATVQSLAFSRGGRLAATGSDGSVRLYPEGRFEQPQRYQIVDKEKNVRLPEDLAFSPDGRLLAVGIADRPMAIVLETAPLRPMAQAALPLGRMARPDNQHMRAVTWIEDGGRAALVAGGHILDANGNHTVLRWNDLNKPPVAQQVVGRNTVLGLTPLPGGRLAYATADPAWGVLDATLAPPLPMLRGAVGDFRQAALGGFRLSDDGMTVEFGMVAGGTERLRFDAVSRQLTKLPPGRGVPNRLPAGLRLQHWENSSAPELRGRVFNLPSGELTRSAAAPENASFFVLGTDTHLRRFRGDGTPDGQLAVPATAWAVALNGDGTVLVAGLGDGTIRWYGLGPDGFRAMALLYPHRDGQRWVLWTPEGFFDHADAGGQDLVGYVLNRDAREAPDWVSFAQLYRTFYAPDLVRGRLAREPDTALRERLAAIGDVRSLLENKRPPAVVLAQICYRETPQGAETCRDIGQAGGTRGLGRIVQEAAPKPSGAPASPAMPQPSAVRTAPTVDLPYGVTAVRLRVNLTPRDGGGIGHVDYFLNDRNVGRDAGSRGLGRERPASATAAPTANQEAAPIPTTLPTSPAPTAPAVLGADAVVPGERTLQLDPGSNLIQVRAYDRANTTFAQSEKLEIRIAEPPSPILPTLHLLAVGVDAYQPPWIEKLKFAVADAKSVAQIVRDTFASTYADVNVVLLAGETPATKTAISKAFAELAAKVEPQDTVIIYMAGHGVLNANGRYFYLPDMPADTSQAGFEQAAIGADQILEWWSRLPARHSIALIDTCHSGGLSLNFAGDLANETGRYVLAASSKTQAANDGFNGKNGLFAVTVLEALNGQGKVRMLPGAVDNFSLAMHVRERVPQLARERSVAQQAEFRGQGLLDPFALTRLRQ